MHFRSRSVLFAALVVSLAAAASAQTPGAPSGLSATINADSSLTLQWTAPSTGGPPSGYVVQIGTSANASDVVNQQIGNVTSHSISSPAPGTSFVRVRALNATGVSGPSNEVTVTVTCTPPTSAPTNITWRASATAIQLTWVPVSGATDYGVEVGTSPGLSDVAMVTTGSALSTFATVAVPTAGTYYVRITAMRTCGAGPDSAELAVVAAAPAPSTTIVVNEFSSFVELKNISTASINIGGWRIHTSNGAAQITNSAAAIPAGVAIPAGCTYLLAVPGDPLTAGMTVDQALSQSIVDGVGVVRADGMIVDAAGRRNSFTMGDLDTPYLEGTPLTARRDSIGIESFARAGDQDTNNNGADFIPLATANPQNAAACLASQPPNAPSNLTVAVSGSTVSLSWTPPSAGGTVNHYRLEAGTVPGTANAGLFDLGADLTTVTFGSVANGTFYVRLRTVNTAGVSSVSNEVVVVVCAAGCSTPPGAVTGLVAQVSDRNVLLQWTRPSSGAAATDYVVEAGTGPGLANLGQFPTGGSAVFVIVSGVPPGTFYVRVRAASVGVLGAASNEIIVVVQ